MNGKNGTTLTETMVAMTIIAFMLAPLFNLFVTFSSRGNGDQKKIQALFYGQGILEIVKAMSSESGINWIDHFHFYLSQHHSIPFEKWQYYKAGDLKGLPPSPFFFFDSATCDACASRFVPHVEACGGPFMKERLKKYSMQEIQANDSKYKDEAFWLNRPFKDFRFIVFLLPSKHFLNPDEEMRPVEPQKVKNDFTLTESTRFIVEVWVLWKLGGKQESIKISGDIESKRKKSDTWRKAEFQSRTNSAKVTEE